MWQKERGRVQGFAPPAAYQGLAPLAINSTALFRNEEGRKKENSPRRKCRKVMQMSLLLDRFRALVTLTPTSSFPSCLHQVALYC